MSVIPEQCVLLDSFCQRFFLENMLVFLITSAKEVMFLPEFVCLSVCLCVSKITQKVVEGSF